MKEPIVIIGGGLSGLAAGYELTKTEYPVTILERDSVLGSLAESFGIDGRYIPIVYHHILVKNLIVIKFNMPLDAISMAWLGHRRIIRITNIFITFSVILMRRMSFS